MSENTQTIFIDLIKLKLKQSNFEEFSLARKEVEIFLEEIKKNDYKSYEEIRNSVNLLAFCLGLFP